MIIINHLALYLILTFWAICLIKPAGILIYVLRENYLYKLSIREFKRCEKLLYAYGFTTTDKYCILGDIRIHTLKDCVFICASIESQFEFFTKKRLIKIINENTNRR